jgi:hypothetical protein
MRSQIVRVMLFVAAMMVVVSPADAKMSPENDPRYQTAPYEGNVECFDYYKYNSVQAIVEPTLQQTVPGAKMNFVGKVVNENEYPVVDVQIYAKVFYEKQKSPELMVRNGYPLVDRFLVVDDLEIPARGERSIEFSWQVPPMSPAGEYGVTTYVLNADRYSLSGLFFTDDVQGGVAKFNVLSDEELPERVVFDKNSATINGKGYYFAELPQYFGRDETVRLEAKLVNPRSETVTVPLRWRISDWSEITKETLRDERAELITLRPNESRAVRIDVPPYDTAVTNVMAEIDDNGSKSILGFRYVRDDVIDMRLNFPSILKYPLRAGEQNGFFTCAHSTNYPYIDDTKLTLVLRDDMGNVLDTFQYGGLLTTGMPGWKKDFTPEVTMTEFSLTGKLEKGGRVYDEVTQVYRCSDIDPSLCEPADSGEVAGAGTKRISLAVLVLLAASLIMIGLTVAFRLRRRNVTQ